MQGEGSPGSLPAPRHEILLPHEAVFGLFMLVTWLRLAVGVGFLDHDALLYATLIAIDVGVVLFCLARPGPLRWRLRLLFYAVAMNLIFLNMRTAVPRIAPHLFDDTLNRVDEAIFGVTPAITLQHLAGPALTEISSACYFLFFWHLAFSMIYYFCAPLPLLKRFWIGLFVIYGLGFLGYSLVPAAGPAFHLADRFGAPLEGGVLTALNDRLVKRGSNGIDVFPSLHCAISALILFFDRRHRRWRFRAYFLPCVGLWISTICLRYHYFIDVICGFALAALALWLAERYRIEEGMKPVKTTPSARMTTR